MYGTYWILYLHKREVKVEQKSPVVPYRTTVLEHSIEFLRSPHIIQTQSQIWKWKNAKWPKFCNDRPKNTYRTWFCWSSRRIGGYVPVKMTVWSKKKIRYVRTMKDKSTNDDHIVSLDQYLPVVYVYFYRYYGLGWYFAVELYVYVATAYNRHVRRFLRSKKISSPEHTGGLQKGKQTSFWNMIVFFGFAKPRMHPWIQPKFKYVDEMYKCLNSAFFAGCPDHSPGQKLCHPFNTRCQPQCTCFSSGKCLQIAASNCEVSCESPSVIASQILLNMCTPISFGRTKKKSNENIQLISLEETHTTK